MLHSPLALQIIVIVYIYINYHCEAFIKNAWMLRINNTSLSSITCLFCEQMYITVYKFWYCKNCKFNLTNKYTFF